MDKSWCECVRMDRSKVERILRTLVKAGADKDYIPLRKYFDVRNTEKTQAMLELLSLANCYGLLSMRTATRAETRSEKNFACVPSGSNFVCVSKVKLVDNWKEIASKEGL